MKSLVKIVKGNEIDISKAKWKQLNAKYSQDEIKQIISDAHRGQ